MAKSILESILGGPRGSRKLGSGSIVKMVPILLGVEIKILFPSVVICKPSKLVIPSGVTSMRSSRPNPVATELDSPGDS